MMRHAVIVVGLIVAACLATEMPAHAVDKAQSDLRAVNLRFVGGDKAIPLAGIRVEVTRGYGEDQKKFGPFQADDKGTVEAKLPAGFYTLHLKSDNVLPFLPVEVLWNKRSRSGTPGLNLRVTDNGAEKWLDGKRRSDGELPAATPGEPPCISYTLLPACELTLRAVDAETGAGLPGAEFYTENALGEDWAHPIENENVGAKPVPDGKKGRENVTDDKGNFRRLVGANANFKYGVAKAPAGYEGTEPGTEVEIEILYGKPRAEHVFKFRRVP